MLTGDWVIDFSDDKSNFQKNDLFSYRPDTGITAVEFLRIGLGLVT